jgi:hypothetical protein
LPDIVEVTHRLGQERTDAIFETGDTRHLGPEAPHICRMYRWSELRDLVEASGGEVLAAGASNCASATLDQAVLERLAADPAPWRGFVDQEARACREPGALDGGTHLLFSARWRQAD